ncbi:hypothetical protein [Prosthecobacter dejongeii]|uniref:Uncharacterized protein n=1 Tax=Prosthecobacter dejongeii TaxID=48465 RepID=A0A7W7YK79_9BACT|nr:hypothetical protein [Prosthecobacter dejongeii]MBB5037706.1 hypothetical protein [Prosthecobacter dejongeii]
MARLFKDRFTEWLITQGTPPSVYQPGGLLGYPPMGWEVKMKHCAIAYVVRPKDPATLVIIMFEREQRRSGLDSPFMDMIRFLSQVRRSDAGITHVTGRIHAIEGRPSDSLETQRMRPFYQIHLGGEYFTDETGVEWVRGSLEKAFEGLKRKK